MPQALRSTETPYCVDDDFVPTSPFDIPWHQEANCYGLGYENFFQDAKLGAMDGIKAAKRVCANCPVRGQCLTSALTYRDNFGVWAGTTPRERRKMLERIDAGETTLEEEVDCVREQ